MPSTYDPTNVDRHDDRARLVGSEPSKDYFDRGGHRPPTVLEASAVKGGRESILDHLVKIGYHRPGITVGDRLAVDRKARARSNGARVVMPPEGPSRHEPLPNDDGMPHYLGETSTSTAETLDRLLRQTRSPFESVKKAQPVKKRAVRSQKFTRDNKVDALTSAYNKQHGSGR